MVLDEAFDAAVCRPLGRWAARGFLRAGIGANQVTLVGTLFGVVAGFALGTGGYWPIAGSLALLVMMVLDCADGEVARLRGELDWRGRLIDGFADLATSFAVHLGLLLHLDALGITLYDHTMATWELFFLALGAGVSLAWNSAVVDDVKQRLKTDSLDRQIDLYRGKARGLVDRFLYGFWVRYVQQTARATGPGRPGGYACYRRLQWAGCTHHLLAISLCGLIAPFWPGIILVYFIAAIVPANLYVAGVLWAARTSEDKAHI
jgi:hypothetical protein